MEGKLIIPIEADITQFKAAFAEANKIVSDFNAQLGRSGATSTLFSDNSIGVLITRISELEVQLEKLRKQFDALKNSGVDSLENIERASRRVNSNAPNRNNQISDPAAKARQSLTALSLVAQDLPFGFIAIQNNLPNLLQYFNELKTQSGGTGSALKNLGSAILGVGGVYLAFSALTAAVTYGIKEYGSLGNAIDALFGKLDPLYKVINRAKEAFDDYNKSAIESSEAAAIAIGGVQGDIIKIETLSNAVLDLSNSEEIRKNALNQLQEIDKERFKNFDIEKGKLEGLTSATEDYTASVIANGVAKAFEQQAIAAATNYQTQLNLLDELTSNLKELDNLYPGLSDAANEYGRAISKYIEQQKAGVILQPPKLPAGIGDLVSDYITLNTKIKEQTKLVESANSEVSKTKDKYKEAILEANKFYKIPTKTETAKAPKDFKFITEESLIGINSIDNVIGKVADYADIILDVNKKTAERVAAVNELKQVDTAYFKNLDVSNMKYADINELITQYIHNLRVLQLEQAGSAAAAKLQQQATENLAEAEKKRQADFEKRTAQDIQFNQPKFTPFKTIELWSNLFSFDKKNADKSYSEIIKELNVLYERLKTGLASPLTFTDQEFESIIKSINDAFQSLDKNMDSVQKKIESALVRPFEDFFTQIIEGGELSFNSLKNFAINALKQIAAKMLALGIAKLITTIMFPQGSALKEGVKGAGTILDVLGAVLGGKKSEANFGGMQGGGMQLAGEVVFVQRGSDLVGVINRTNGTINRVG